MSKKTQAVGSVRVAGDVGKRVARGTKLVHGSGVEFTIAGDATIGADELAVVAITAVPDGPSGELTPGSILRFKRPVEGVDDEVEVDANGVKLPDATTPTDASSTSSTAAPTTASSATPTPPAADNSSSGTPSESDDDLPRVRLNIMLNGHGRTQLMGVLVAPGSVRTRTPSGRTVVFDDVVEFDPASPELLPSYELVRSAATAKP